MAMRNVGSSSVAKVSQKFTSSYLTLVTSAGCAYVKYTFNEEAEFDKRLDSESWDCADMAERYRANAEAVNAELMKIARAASEK